MIVTAVHISNGSIGEFVDGGVVQARDAHAIELAMSGRIANPERPHPAVLAEEMSFNFRFELILAQIDFACG